MGPRAWSFWVLMPISAPKPNSAPSVKRVDALTTTVPASTASVKRPAAARSRVRMASVWPEPNRLTWSMAASSDGTTATLILRARNSRPKSSSVASPIAGTRARAPASPTSSTPCSTSAAATAGRKASATASCTTSDSAALHTLGPLRLGVDHDVERVVEVGRRVDVHVAVAVAVDDHGDGGVVADALDQRRAATRDEAVDDVGELHELDRGLVAHVVDEQHRVGRAARPW